MERGQAPFQLEFGGYEMNYIPFIAAAILLAGGFGAAGGSVYLYSEGEEDVISGGDGNGDLEVRIIENYGQYWVIHPPGSIQLQSYVENGDGELTYAWRTEAGTILSDEQNPTIEITEDFPGGYITIILTVTDEDGDTGSDSFAFEIGAPSSMINIIEVDIGNEFPIDDDDGLSFDIGHEIGIFAFPRIDGPPPVEVSFALTGRPFGLFNFFWYFNDGDGYWSGSTASHVFNSTGNYTVTYSTYVPVGPDNITTLGSVDIIILGEEPEEGLSIDMDIPEFPPGQTHYVFEILINATPPTGPAPLYVNFGHNLAPAMITGFLWSFGDGGPVSFDRSTSHIFIDPGVYHVTVTYASGYGSYGYGEIDIIVEDSQSDELSVEIEVIPTQYSLTFHFNAHPSFDDPLDYDWYFSDDVFVAGREIIHGFSLYGMVYAIVHAYNEELGLSATARVEFFIPEEGAPNVHFIINTDPNDPSHLMFEPIVGLGTPPFSYSWLFGDGFQSSEYDPSHYYSEEGYYKVELYVLDDVGGVGYYSENIYVYSGTYLEPI